MDSSSMIDKIFPGFATTGDIITTVFDSGILILFLFFLVAYLILFRKYACKIHGIVKILKKLRGDTQNLSMREDLWGLLRNTLFYKKIHQQDPNLIKHILKQNKYTKGIADSLVEYKSKLYLSQDVDYYINENTLAPSILCSRLFPLGAALLTGLGVLGTFVGLLIGLDGLEICKSASADAAKTISAIDQITSGASVAFATSVTGVFFSLLLNLIEKSVTSCMAVCVRHIQEDLSDHFPPFPTMDVFKDTGESSDKSAKLLGELGDKMQKSMDSFFQSMLKKLSDTMSDSAEKMGSAVANSLDVSLRDKLVPAVKSISAAAVDLSVRQVHSSEEALKSVVDQFMEKFGEQGEAQRKAMLDATEQFQKSSSSLSSSMDTIMLQMKEQQDTLAARQQEQMEKLSSSFCEMSAEQNKNIELAGQKIETLLESFSGQMAEEFKRQTESLGGVTDSLHSSLSSMVEHAKDQQDTLIARQQEQMEKLSSSFCEMSAEQNKNIELAGQKIETLLESFSGQMAEEFKRQTESLGGVTDNLHSSLSSVVENAKEIFDRHAGFMKDMLGSVNVLIAQGKALQFNIDETKESFSLVAEAVQHSSSDLAEAGGALERFGNDITQSVEKTTSLYMALEKQFRSAKEGLDNLLDEFDDLKDKFSEVAERNSNTVVEASKNYRELADNFRQLPDKLHEHAKEIEEVARKQVQDFQESMTKSLNEYAKSLDEYGQKVNAQVTDRMSEWNRQTEKFCHIMVAAIDKYADTVEDISDVVDKIKEK